MAEIKTLKQGETQVLPRTIAEAVNTDSGLSVQAELDALKESTPDVSAQINEHNVAEDAHANRFANYLPLSGGMMTGSISFDDNENTRISKNGRLDNVGIKLQSFVNGLNGIDVNSYVDIADEENPEPVFQILLYKNKDNGNPTTSMSLKEGLLDFKARNNPIILNGIKTPQENNQAANKKYVDDQIAAIPTPDVSAQIEAHNTSTAAHANMHWLIADDEMLSSITLDGSIDADTLEGHPASYFATKTDLSGYVLKSELSTLVPAPDLSNYYTKEEVDTKITQIQQLIDEAAALVDQINGEVI